jgi:hypothetical protein
MRNWTFGTVAVLATLMLRCGGSDGATHLQHPTLDQDYADQFAGTWQGSATVVVGGSTQVTPGSQRIDRTGFNRISIYQVCLGADGAAGLDTATSFSMDPLTCPPSNQQCGPITIKYDSAVGSLSQSTLTVTLKGSASGCGQNLPFVITFTGTLPH